MEQSKGFTFRVLADAGALPEGSLDIIRAEVQRGLNAYLRDLKAGKYIAERSFVSVDELLSTKYHPSLVPSNVIPFSTRRRQ